MKATLPIQGAYRRWSIDFETTEEEFARMVADGIPVLRVDHEEEVDYSDAERMRLLCMPAEGSG